MRKCRFSLLSLIVFLGVCARGPMASVVINEIMYHPVSDRVEDEYVELFNTGGESVDLSGWSLKGVGYDFPGGTSIEPEQHIVIAKDPQRSESTHGIEALGPYDGILKDGGERLRLVDADGVERDRVEYDDRHPWPVAADGLGTSLECINPAADNNHPRNWRAAGEGAEWQFVEVTDQISSSRVYFYLQDAGECLIDDVRLVSEGGQPIAGSSEWIAYPMNYRHTPGGSQSLNMHFSNTAVIFDDPIRPQSIVLPDNPKIMVFAITLTTAEGEVQLDLADAFNLDGISWPENLTDGNLDGGGATYAAELLPENHIVESDDGLPTVSWMLGSYEDGALNCIRSQGQTIPVPSGSYTGIHLLASAVNTQTEDATLSLESANGVFQTRISVTDWAVALPEGPTGDASLLVNGNFEQSSGWNALGAYSGSHRWSGDAQEGSYSMRVVGTGPGLDHRSSVWQTVTGIQIGGTYTLSFWAKGLSGNGVLVSRFSGNSHLVETSLSKTGTPGARNTAYSEDIPPFIVDITRTPEVPTSSDLILVTARIDDTEGLASTVFSYQVNDESWQDVPISDGGDNGDAAAGDGVYSAFLPPAASQSIIRFKVLATDTAGQVTSAPLAGEPTAVYGVFVYDGELQSKIPIYWLFLGEDDYRDLLRNPQSNNFKKGTVAIGGRAYDNVGIRFRGQWARSWPKKSWKLRFNKDNYFNGRRTVNLNSAYHDRAYIREYLCYRFYREAGTRACNAEMVHLRLNGEFYGLEVDVEQVNEQFLERNELDSDGNLYKSKQGGDLRPLGSESRYHGPFEKKTNEHEDWNDLKALADGLAETPSGGMYVFLEQNVPVDEILRYWAATTILQNWDSIIKNHYVYHDTDDTGLWHMFPWDLDRTWGEYASWQLGAEINILAGMRAHPPGFGLPSDWSNRLIDAMLKQPSMLDRYYQHIRIMLRDVFTEDRINMWIDEQYENIRDLVDDDQRQWGTHGPWQPFRQEIENCKTFVRERRAFLFDSMPAPVHDWSVH